MLRREQEEYDTEQLRHEKESETIRKPSEWLCKAAQPNDTAIRRQEHYSEWLATQNILDQMRESDMSSVATVVTDVFRKNWIMNAKEIS